MTRHLLRVSCKCALYTPDGKKVLLVEYGAHGFGLPGGHLDPDETPDQAMERELSEELGLSGIELQRKDFFFHPNGKLVLGFTARLEESTPLVVQLDEISGAVWVGVDQIASGAVEAPSYKDFILSHQP